MNPQVQTSLNLTLHDVEDTKIILGDEELYIPKQQSKHEYEKRDEQEEHEENNEQKEQKETPSLHVNKKIMKKKSNIKFSSLPKRNGNNDNSISHLRKGIFIVLQAPLQNKDDDDYSYHKNEENDSNPLWIAKIEKFYRKKGFADLCFYRAKGRNIIETSPSFEIDNQVFRVYNIIDAFQFTICHSEISKDGILKKLEEKNQ